MVDLLDDVLTMSKSNAGKLDFKPQTIALRPFCDQIWDNFREIAEKTHAIEFVYNCDATEVIFDSKLIQYILVNLLSNAVKYSPTNGRVLFEVVRDHNDLVFRISDNGIGIPDKDQAKLFEPFHRAVNTKGIEGTGLGLSIVKSYVEVHNGVITFESKEGQGTIFTISIPFVSA